MLHYWPHQLEEVGFPLSEGYIYQRERFKAPLLQKQVQSGIYAISRNQIIFQPHIC